MAKKPKILCVDDEQDILDLLQYIMETEGYEVKVARNGIEAIEACTLVVLSTGQY